jgi:hypothetical protein
MNPNWARSFPSSGIIPVVVDGPESHWHDAALRF